ncbi:bifunctional riboflavin kinase/FMN phosphatase-like isoform X2 [Nymphaea colorata]|uniref:bifunctional riboflavin kinase/FMN phosphatase-like isoform X2 n=1 Tax=Nymphaea colorata TaxID=210225 RepID=UPI00129E4823|nr:bifunctional riboflavin kinase/FMN phosphatase-like isoform X2 [Nymphaea colorata]
MAMKSLTRKLVSCVILDLDGTLINTEGVVEDVLKVFLVKYGKQWDGRGTLNRTGKAPIEAAASIIEDYGLPCTTEEFMTDIAPLFSDCWSKMVALPGAERLIKHLHNRGVPIALASNSPKASIETKLSYHHGWKERFSVIIGGDEVREGKPSPEIFLEAANNPGITAGKAAGMAVVAVPSVPNQTHVYSCADEVINSLLDLHLENWGLPPFQDWIEGTLPIGPWYIGGPVIKGYGRGSKVLGIPTANISPNGFSDILSVSASGVYFGWAGLSTRGIYKMVMSIGWNPYFHNAEKTIEPWLLHDFNEDFYGEELRLAIVGYIRPEANFPSLDDLIKRIHEDRRIAEKALDLPLYSSYKGAPYLITPLVQDDR